MVLCAVSQTLAAPTLDIQLVTANVTNPVYITHAGDDSGRLFIVEQTGRIKIFDGTNLLATPFLDIANQVLFSGEQGLLSVAFHPGYKTNGYFYVYFTDSSRRHQQRRCSIPSVSARRQHGEHQHSADCVAHCASDQYQPQRRPDAVWS